MKTVELYIETQQKKQVIDITYKINEQIQKLDIKNGLCNVFVLHSTAALSIADLDPGTDLDMLDAFYEMIPKLKYRHPHNPQHVPDHILSTLIGPSVTVPIQNGELLLGIWQKVVLFEFNGPRTRQINLSFIV
ncbi:MAG: secondary thiamine-phosphate synthase enzyme YjbQ [Minisyncoccia bacterium]